MNLNETSKFQGSDAYRKLPHLNYSAIKTFDENRNKFYRQYMLKETVEEKKSDSVIFGDLVHCLMFSPEELDNKFSMLGTGVLPKPQMKAFADNLWEVTKRNMVDGVVSREMSELMKEAFDMTAYDRNGERIAFKGKTIESVIERFPSEAEFYYNKLREDFGKPIITTRTMTNAENLCKELKVNPVTKHIFTIKDSKRYSVFHEEQILFEKDGERMKAMCDLLIVDHEEKRIYLYDLKCTGWDVDSFEFNIIRNKYYLQWSIYYLAVQSWAKEKNLNYEIVPMQFIVISTDSNENPLIYTTSVKDVNYGLYGFTTKTGRKCKGLDQLMTEIKWHMAYSIWNMSYTDYHNNGIKKISLFEENS